MQAFIEGHIATLGEIHDETGGYLRQMADGVKYHASLAGLYERYGRVRKSVADQRFDGLLLPTWKAPAEAKYLASDDLASLQQNIDDLRASLTVLLSA